MVPSPPPGGSSEDYRAFAVEHGRPGGALSQGCLLSLWKEHGSVKCPELSRKRPPWGFSRAQEALVGLRGARGRTGLAALLGGSRLGSHPAVEALGQGDLPEARARGNSRANSVADVKTALQEAGCTRPDRTGLLRATSLPQHSPVCTAGEHGQRTSSNVLAAGLCTVPSSQRLAGGPRPQPLPSSRGHLTFPAPITFSAA